MRITTKCHSCSSEIIMFTLADDRVQLSMSKGKKFERRCKNCGQSDTYHINDFKAERNKYILLIGYLVLLIALLPIAVFVFWDQIKEITWIYSIVTIVGVSTLPIVVYGIIRKETRLKINSFNRTYVKEKT